MPENLITIFAKANTHVTSAYEQAIEAAVRGGQTVEVASIPAYVGTETLAQDVTLIARGSDGFKLAVRVSNGSSR